MSDFATQSLPLLRVLPVPLAALLMQQVLRYDRMFPREQRELEATLQSLRLPRSPQMQHAVDAFAALRLPPSLQTSGWETKPLAWTEQITAVMWSTGQIEGFRNAAKLVLPSDASTDRHAQARAVAVVFDQELRSDQSVPTLFQRLRPSGTHFTTVSGAGTAIEADWLQSRVQQSQEPYAHWLVSGDVVPLPAESPVAKLSYAELRPARQRLLRMMNDARQMQGTGGPEGLRDAMRALTPGQMGLPATTDPVLSEFATDVLVGGSGTQLYATTFVQWTAREVLRRVQPRTLIAHFSPRNQSTSMDLRLAEPLAEPPLDNAGSLIDAEMGAHLTWINLQRLPGADRAHFLAWHPGYLQALLIGPGVGAGTQVQAPTMLHDLLARMA